MNHFEDSHIHATVRGMMLRTRRLTGRRRSSSQSCKGGAGGLCDGGILLVLLLLLLELGIARMLLPREERHSLRATAKEGRNGWRRCPGLRREWMRQRAQRICRGGTEGMLAHRNSQAYPARAACPSVRLVLFAAYPHPGTLLHCPHFRLDIERSTKLFIVLVFLCWTYQVYTASDLQTSRSKHCSPRACSVHAATPSRNGIKPRPTRFHSFHVMMSVVSSEL